MGDLEALQTAAVWCQRRGRVQCQMLVLRVKASAVVCLTKPSCHPHPLPRHQTTVDERICVWLELCLLTQRGPSEDLPSLAKECHLAAEFMVSCFRLRRRGYVAVF